jgi:hypothetical protein
VFNVSTRDIKEHVNSRGEELAVEAQRHRQMLMVILEHLQQSSQPRQYLPNKLELRALGLDDGFAMRRFLDSRPPSPSFQISGLSGYVDGLDLAVSSDQMQQVLVALLASYEKRSALPGRACWTTNKAQ